MPAHDPQESANVKSKIASGFSILFAREFTLKIFAFIGQLILARILSPSDFGYYVIIIFIINFFLLFSDIGLSYAIIRHQTQPTQKELEIIFTIKFLLSVSLTCLIIFFAPFVTAFYPTFSPMNIFMLQLVSFVLILTALRAVPIALMEREIDYRAISTIDIAGVLFYYISALFLAFLGFHIWSFIFATLLKELVEVAIVYILKPWIPSFNFEIKKVKNMIRFGFFVQGNGFLNFLSTGIIPILGGTQSGPYAVGILNWASNLATAPDAAISNNFGRVAFAGFSRLQHDTKALTHTIEKSISIMSVITFLLPLLIFGYGAEGTAILYTNKWLAGIPALYWFTAVTIFSSTMVPLGQGILVTGNSKYIFYATLLSNLFNWLGSFVLLNKLGYLAIPVSTFFSALMLCIFYFYIAYKVHIRIRYSKILLPKIIAFFIIYLLIYFLNTLSPHTIIFLILKVLITFLCYFFLIFLFSRSDFAAIIVYVFTFLKLTKFAEKAKKLNTNPKI